MGKGLFENDRWWPAPQIYSATIGENVYIPNLKSNTPNTKSLNKLVILENRLLAESFDPR